MADEEEGGAEGARWLLDHHADLVGFGEGRPPPEVIGEGAYGVGGTLERPVIPIAVGEKTAVWQHRRGIPRARLAGRGCGRTGRRAAVAQGQQPAAVEREPALDAFLDRVREGGLSYKPLTTATDLESLLRDDLVVLLTERFHHTRDERPQ